MMKYMFSRTHWLLAKSPEFWGKIPSCGDFIRHNLSFEREKALEEWVRQKRGVLSPPREILRRKVTNGIPWHSLEPQSSRRQSIDVLTFGYSGQPWCFVLPPQSPPFAVNHYLLGVWMESYDKVGRAYPFIMIQEVTRRWAKQYFALHVRQPCEWLFNAARLIANSIRAQESKTGQFFVGEIDHAATLLTKLNALWLLYAPSWRNFLGKRITLPDGKSRWIQELLESSGSNDPARDLDGVRFLPWADWPYCMLRLKDEGYFWQQNLRGRFISAVCA
jgi:type VI secretion system protein ImpM